MEETVTWLHLSDLHICNARDGWEANPILDGLIADLKLVGKQYGLQPDLFFFTGDAAFGELSRTPGKSLKDQFTEVEEFFDKVRAAFPSHISKENTFIIPGNHDVNRSRVTQPLTSWLDQLAEQEGGLAKINRMIQDGGNEWDSYAHRLDDFGDFLTEHSYTHLLKDRRRYLFSAQRELAGIRVGIAGFNSAWSCGRASEKAKLWFAGEWQANRLAAELKAQGTVFNIALVHHPASWFVEAEDPRISRVLEQNFHMVLHGHEHQGWVLHHSDGFTRIAGAAGFQGPMKENGYNIVRINVRNNSGEVWLRRFDPFGGGWIPRVVYKKTNNEGAWALKRLNLASAAQASEGDNTTFSIAPLAINVRQKGTKRNRANLLGSPTAEDDQEMLDAAFFESADYRTLIEGTDKSIVVGRRGTGKSALFYQLGKYWQGVAQSAVVKLAPEKIEALPLYHSLACFGNEFDLIQSASKLLWRHALLLEIGAAAFRQKNIGGSDAKILTASLAGWRNMPNDIFARLTELVTRHCSIERGGVENLKALSRGLQTDALKRSLEAALEAAPKRCIVLIDKLDEGYSPNEASTAFIDGLLLAVLEINGYPEPINASAYIFLRDNMYRAVSRADPDHSRNIEGHVLRLHWEEPQLLNLVCARLKHAFELNLDKDVKVWNRVTANELQGVAGFKKALRHTLYRPRDVLQLLNDAFLYTKRAGRDGSTIVFSDIEAVAKTISANRLDDLIKEYSAIIPGLSIYTATFANTPVKQSAADAANRLEDSLKAAEFNSKQAQDFAILGSGNDIIRALYSVGFLGLYDKSENRFVYCHDGNNPNKDLVDDDSLLIHPCYWSALNSTQHGDEPLFNEIFDEYEIRVKSITPQQRERNISSLVSTIDSIPISSSARSEFDAWCEKMIRIAFAGGLRDFKVIPSRTDNGTYFSAINPGQTKAWAKILQQFHCQRVLFGGYNSAGRDFGELVQTLGGQGPEFGKLAFAITRDDEWVLRQGPVLDNLRETYRTQQVLTIRLTAQWLNNIVYKLRSPEKHDAVEAAMLSLLQTYNLYLISPRHK